MNDLADFYRDIDDLVDTDPIELRDIAYDLKVQVIELQNRLANMDQLLSGAWSFGLAEGIGYAVRIQNNPDTWGPTNPYRKEYR